MARLVKILTIDGGGMRGVIPATVLMEIERRTGKPAAKLFDLIAGTSTGGILAVGLASGYSAAALRQLYLQQARVIFPSSQFPLSVWDLSKRPFAEKYPSQGIESVLKKYFGNRRLKDSACQVLVPSYEIHLRQPWFFRSCRAREDPAYDFALWEVARATSAAPTYFPPARIGSWTLIDGGTFANNPAMCAYADARRADPAADILLVSLGTGRHVEPVAYRPGLLGWASPILNIVFDGVSRTVEYQLQDILPLEPGRRQYYRFQTDLTIAGDAIDDTRPASLAALQREGEHIIAAQEADLAALCAVLA